MPTGHRRCTTPVVGERYRVIENEWRIEEIVGRTLCNARRHGCAIKEESCEFSQLVRWRWRPDW
jgi:hypothetical protein